MNILGLISMFLLLFAFISARFSSHSRAFQRQACEQLRQRTLQQERYNYLRTSKHKGLNFLSIESDKKNSPPEQEERPAYKKGPYPDSAKCNLAVVLQGNAAMEEVFLNLLDLLYQHPQRQSFKDFNAKIFTNDLLALIKKEQESKRPVFLEKLVWEDEDQQKQYYFFLHSIANTPSLLDLCRFNVQKKKIDVPSASKEMLIALFGSSIAEKLLQKQKNPKHKLEVRKDELRELLRKEGLTLSPQFWSILRLSPIQQTE